MLKYEVGEQVKIIDNLSMDMDYAMEGHEPTTCATGEMIDHRGSIATITKVEIDYYGIDLDNGEWCWVDEMFVDEKTTPEQREERKFWEDVRYA